MDIQGGGWHFDSESHAESDSGYTQIHPLASFSQQHSNPMEFIVLASSSNLFRRRKKSPWFPHQLLEGIPLVKEHNTSIKIIAHFSQFGLILGRLVFFPPNHGSIFKWCIVKRLQTQIVYKFFVWLRGWRRNWESNGIKKAKAWRKLQEQAKEICLGDLEVAEILSTGILNNRLQPRITFQN